MIGRLTGRVTHEDEGAIVLDVHGVGYEVTVPLGTIERAQANQAGKPDKPGNADEDGRVTLFVHTHVRQDTFSLFGFASDTDRLAFRMLIGISSVGPKTAIAVLSALPAPDLGQAIARKELRKLTSIPGIGKKTAERLLLELNGKLPIVPTAGPRTYFTPTQAASSAPMNPSDLLSRALINMGYRQAEVDRATLQLGAKVGELGLPDLLKEALAVLSK
ncbi:MAG: Holliday junction branch migration protein RuvA [Polyangiaceae bacterium]|nr:Holliday junction branch migration protein RuvA [Polyangiaceae bacterium]